MAFDVGEEGGEGGAAGETSDISVEKNDWPALGRGVRVMVRPFKHADADLLAGEERHLRQRGSPRLGGRLVGARRRNRKTTVLRADFDRMNDDRDRQNDSVPKRLPDDAPNRRPIVHRSDDLLQGAKEAWIEHAGVMYRLRLTSAGKLYLTK